MCDLREEHFIGKRIEAEQHFKWSVSSSLKGSPCACGRAVQQPVSQNATVTPTGYAAAAGAPSAENEAACCCRRSRGKCCCVVAAAVAVLAAAVALNVVGGYFLHKVSAREAARGKELSEADLLHLALEIPFIVFTGNTIHSFHGK